MKHWKTQNKLRSFLYGKLQITDELYIERVHCVRRREGTKSNSNNAPRTILAKLLDYKQKEEIMRWCYILKETTCSVREDFSKETDEIGKELWDQVKKLQEYDYQIW